MKLAEALDDRASFRRFCGFSRSEATPERTAFVRYRRKLVEHSLDGSLFETVTAQLKARAVTVKTGTMVDASLTTAISFVHWLMHQTASFPSRATLSYPPRSSTAFSTSVLR